METHAPEKRIGGEPSDGNRGKGKRGGIDSYGKVLVAVVIAKTTAEKPRGVIISIDGDDGGGVNHRG